MGEPGRQQMLLLPITVAGGTGSGTITNQWDIARWVRVIPPAESDTYDVTFKDADGDVITVRTGMTGTMSERLELSMGILRSIEIANYSGSNGTFKAKFDMN